MLKQLVLKNFRQHEDLTLNFTPGLNTLKGANEAGKSSVNEAILYTLFGTRALRESLSEVVTYDKPENSLSVNLTFEIDGVEYRMVRKKSGAELTYGDQIVTGQTETKSFVERLLGCSADTAKTLLIADQGSIRGVLSQGSSAAGSLVEKLADLQVIDNLIDKVQTQLPSGNTKAVEAQIDLARESLAEPPEPPSNAEVLAAQNRWSSTRAQLEKFQARTAILAPKFVAAKLALARAAEVQKEAVQIEKRRAALLEQVKPVPAPDVTEDQLAEARRLAADSAALDKVRKAYATKFPVTALVWDGTEQTLQARVAELKVSIPADRKKMQAEREELVAVKATRINESTCSFCKQDISALPLVAQTNAKVDSEVHRLALAVDQMQKELMEDEEELQGCTDLLAHCSKVRQLAGEYWALSSDVPPVPSWIGEPPPPAGELPDVASMEKKLQAYRRSLAVMQVAEQELASLVVPAVPDTADAEAVVAEAEELQRKEQAAKTEVNLAQQALAHAQQMFAASVSAHQNTLAQIEKAQQQLQQMVDSLNQMREHNNLIKKLRDARPEITAKLWASVLGSISHYFSQIRGMVSSVQRSAGGFTVNGRTVEGLSGSTQDALGLAIRISLSKVFLPSVPLLILDESFAACDDVREVSGLGVLASSGFEQVLLVTHSDLADSISANLICL